MKNWKWWEKVKKSYAAVFRTQLAGTELQVKNWAMLTYWLRVLVTNPLNINISFVNTDNSTNLSKKYIIYQQYTRSLNSIMSMEWKSSFSDWEYSKGCLKYQQPKWTERNWQIIDWVKLPNIRLFLWFCPISTALYWTEGINIVFPCRKCDWLHTQILILVQT